MTRSKCKLTRARFELALFFIKKNAYHRPHMQQKTLGTGTEVENVHEKETKRGKGRHCPDEQ